MAKGKGHKRKSSLVDATSAVHGAVACLIGLGLVPPPPGVISPHLHHTSANTYRATRAQVSTPRDPGEPLTY